MNPYASFLGSQDPLTVIASTPEALRQAIARHASSLDVPRAPGKWSPRQILGHLADTEIAFAMRLRQTVADTHHIIQPFDQDGWSAANPTPDAQTALNMFAALRAANIEFIRAQPAAMMAKPVTHPERGTMTFGTIVETMAGHDLNHLGQL
jgi:DinB superfamily